MKAITQKIILILLYLFCLLSLTASQELTTITPEEVGLSSEHLERLNKAIQTHIDKGELSGAVTLIARRGEIAHFRAYGWQSIETKKPMLRDAIFRIASMAKPITSIATLILYEEDRFSLTDPVSKYLPDLENMEVAVLTDDNQYDVTELKTEPAKRTSLNLLA